MDIEVGVEKPASSNQPTKENAMDNNGYPGNDFTNIIAAAAVFGGGFLGRGGYGGYGPHAGGHYGGRVADEAIVATLQQPSAADHRASAAETEARISDLQRDVAGIGRDLQNNLAGINRDLQFHGQATLQKLADCCCETQKEILGSRHATELGFKDMTSQLCNVQTNILNKMTEQETERLNRELGDCKSALSTANQTTQLGGMIAQAVASGVGQVTAQCCCDPCGGHHRGRGFAPTANGGGWTPPGQDK
jgi:hypothetical protein